MMIRQEVLSGRSGLLSVVMFGAVLITALGSVSFAEPARSTGAFEDATELSCAEGGPCRVGDQGPGGGIVVYAGASPRRWGRYLEVAPTGWNGGDDPALTWCNRAVSASTRTGLGEGRENTIRLQESCPESQVAEVVLSYAGGGEQDWYVPSRDELRKANRERSRLGMTAHYWSSSINPGSMTSMILNQNFSRPWDPFPSNPAVRGIRVRPMRAFDCTQCG